MNLGAKPNMADEIAAALDWWRDAGVDGDLQDTTQSWLAVPASDAPLQDKPVVTARAPETPKTAPATAFDRSDWPSDLAMFAPWWLSAPMLDNGQTANRVPPRGPAGTELMVLIPEPEREDRDALLSGPQGQLLSAILTAMGLSPETVYLASALPRHTPHADWDTLNQQGMGDVLRLHVQLAAPKRLICFGNSILPLLGNDPANKPGALNGFDHNGVKVPLMAARELAVLLERPRWKEAFWQDWLDWSAAG